MGHVRLAPDMVNCNALCGKNFTIPINNAQKGFALSVGEAEKVQQLAITYSKLLQIRNTGIIFLPCYCDRLVRTKRKKISNYQIN